MIRVLRSNRRGRRAQRNAGEISTVKFGPLHVVIWRRVLLYLWCCCGASCGTTDVSFSLHRAGSDFAFLLGFGVIVDVVCAHITTMVTEHTHPPCVEASCAHCTHCGYEERIGSLRFILQRTTEQQIGCLPPLCDPVSDPVPYSRDRNASLGRV
ncbi:hypothetical protein EDB84DRAFT_1543194 [Lactarius hengduanensis]|nr:hypothetical protein EDB84DRAFT_1543194 [Lactarius hengduanensis]